MTVESVKATVIAEQRHWALRAGLAPDSRGYVASVTDNLRVAMSARTRAAFENADGGELLDVDGRPAKMRALHSSSALAVNVFAHWEDRFDLTALLSAMHVAGAGGVLEFERKMPTGARGTPPNVDVVITTSDGMLVGVESKFTEWMTPKDGPVKNLAPYLADEDSFWTWAGMPAADRIARAVDAGEDVYHHLDVPQLLKHSLGLARAAGTGRWVLRYLYANAPGEIATTHAAEIARFSERVASDIDFRAVSYQALVAALARDGTIDRGYLAYLQTRYAF